MEKADLVVIGTGPGGHYGAIQAAKLGKKVVAIEEYDRVGGAAAITGTIPSKSLREAALHLTGLHQRAFYGIDYMVKEDLTVQDLRGRTEQVIRNETAVLQAQLRRNRIKLVHGKGCFVGPHRVLVETEYGEKEFEGDVVLLAPGSRPSHPPDLPFDGVNIVDSNQILDLPSLPKSLIVVGAGIIGMEYGCIFSALGVEVILVNQQTDVLEFADEQIVDVLKYHMQDHDVSFRLGEEVISLETRGNIVVVKTKSNKEMTADCVLYTIGRRGNTESLKLENAGLTADNRGRIRVNEHYQTEVPHIYAAGDVIGFPSLAATSREQGRLAMCHAFGMSSEVAPAKLPFGIYTIPEISMVGPTERELTEQAIPYEIGVARYREIARGQIVGDIEGMLKILFHRETLKILAVHIIGEGATELVHIGQAVEAFGGTLEYFVNTVFNYPTLAECYKVAAHDGINRLCGITGTV